MDTTNSLVRETRKYGKEIISFLHPECVKYRVHLQDTEVTSLYREQVFKNFSKRGWDCNPAAINRISRDNISPRELLECILFVKKYGDMSINPPEHEPFKNNRETEKYVDEIFKFAGESAQKKLEKMLMQYSEEVSLKELSPFLKELGFKPDIFPRPPAIGGKASEITYEMLGL